MTTKELDEKIRKRFNLSEVNGWVIKSTGEIVVDRLDALGYYFVPSARTPGTNLGFVEDL